MTPKERAAMRQAIEFIVDCEYGKAELALREALDHSGEANEMVGCAYCNNPLFAGTKCNNCGLVTLAEPKITTPDVCGEVCARAKLCYGFNKDLEEANAKYAEQAEQEPVAWMQKATVEWIKQPRNERNQTQVIATGVNVFDGQVPLYAAPPRTKDLTDDEIANTLEKTLVVEDERFEFQGGRILTIRESELLPIARAVIEKFKEKNK